MKKLLACLFSVNLLCGSCQSSQQTVNDRVAPSLSEKLSPAIVAAKAESPPVQPKKLKLPTKLPTKTQVKTTAIKIFRADDLCQNLVAETKQIPKQASEKMVAVTLKDVLEQQVISDFKVKGYDVKLDNGVATVDIKVDPSSERRITSLSSCEQFSLFKSIEATLTKNSSLDVYEVRFTQSGQEVYL